MVQLNPPFLGHLLFYHLFFLYAYLVIFYERWFYLNCNSVLFDFILGHFSPIATPLGHHLRLAERHLVHLLDVVVQVARRAACVLADRTDPRLCSTGENRLSDKNKGENLTCESWYGLPGPCSCWFCTHSEDSWTWRCLRGCSCNLASDQIACIHVHIHHTCNKMKYRGLSYIYNCLPLLSQWHKELLQDLTDH